MKKFAVIGNPIAHSKSPQIHALFAAQFGHDIDYQKVLSPKDSFQATIQSLIEEHYHGVNITLPFKEQAFQLANETSDRATIAGAANTLSFHQGSIKADNTDGQGLVEDLNRIIGPLTNKNILLIGAGGAAKGSILPIVNAGAKMIRVFNRTAEKADNLVQQFDDYRVTRCEQQHLKAQQFEIIINSTSTSVTGDVPQLDYNVFAQAQLAYDMFYDNSETAFMQLASAHAPGIKTSDGFGMLVGQAAESYRIWHGVKPDIQQVINFMRPKVAEM